MKKRYFPLIFMMVALLQFCSQKKNNSPSKELILDLQLKKGQIISCGPPESQLGTAEFLTSCSKKIKDDFNLGFKLLHSFEYDEAEKAFAKVVDTDPGCAMAYWGIAMSNFHPLWSPPTEDELKKGVKAVQIAKTLSSTKKEVAYIDAVASFYKDWETTDHRTRCLDFEKGMEKVNKNFPEDKEAAIFYSLSLVAASDPADKSYSKQKKAGDILQALYPGQPDHPGIVHYLIHTYDYPELAHLGLEPARKYASIAASSSHALHMPSHIFTRLGLWDECIQSNKAAVASAQCYAVATGMKGHWDEEMHGLDYLMYAYLQKGANDSAKKQWDYLKTINEVNPFNFKVAYSFAAIPSRYVLENSMWTEAANLKIAPADLTADKYPWQVAIIHFTRLLGAVNLGDLHTAKEELQQLNRLRDTLINQKDTYKSNQVTIQVKAGDAWIHFKEGKNSEALTLMQVAADMEDKTEKHPVTPGEVIPARELLGDMLLQMKKPEQALAAYQANLLKHPNRFNALFRAGVAAERSGNVEKAIIYFEQLLSVVGNTKSSRTEVNQSKSYLKSLAAR